MTHDIFEYNYSFIINGILTEIKNRLTSFDAFSHLLENRGIWEPKDSLLDLWTILETPQSLISKTLSIPYHRTILNNF